MKREALLGALAPLANSPIVCGPRFSDVSHQLEVTTSNSATDQGYALGHMAGTFDWEPYAPTCARRDFWALRLPHF